MAPRARRENKKPPKTDVAPAPAPAETAERAPAGIGHNLTSEERESQFLRHMDGIRAARAATENAKAALKAIRKQETLKRHAAQKDGYPLKIVDEILDDEAKTKADLAGFEESRRFMRSTVGLLSGVQIDLFAALEPEARTEAEWGEMGYNAGIKGKEANPPAEMPPEFVQAWLKRWGAAQEKLAWALSDKGINPDRSRTDLGTSAVQLEPEPEDEKAANDGPAEDGETEGEDAGPGFVSDD